MKHNLQTLFYPQGIAVVGASEDRGKLGYNITENLIRFGFPGEIYPVNPKHRVILGRKSYPSLDAITGPVDLVLSAVGARATVKVAEECSIPGIKALVAYAASFREVGRDGGRLEGELKETAERSGMAVLGPNTPGFINGNLPLNATFFPFKVQKGNVAIITQSGGVGGAIYRKALEENLSVGLWIGVGNRVNVDFADILLFLGQDETVDVVGIYMEATEKGEQLISAAREVTASKPVVIYKAGRSKDADRLTLSHTGSLSGSEKVYKGLLKQAGLIYVDSVTELVSACKGLALAGKPGGERIGIITPSGGGSIVVFDLLKEQGCSLPAFAPGTENKIRDLMNNTSSVVYKNPLDLTTDGFEADLYGNVVEALAMDKNIDLILAIFPVHEYFPPPDEKLIEIRKKVGKPIVVYWIAIDLLDHEYSERRKVLESNGIPVFLLPEEAAWATRGLVNYHRNRMKGI